MLIATGLLSTDLLTAVALVQGALLLIALWLAPWRHITGVSTHSHLLFAAIVGLAFLWQLNGYIAPSVSLHLLGMTTVTLILGAPLAIVSGTVASLGLALAGKLALSEVLAHALINASVPALITAGLLQLVMRYGPRNVFMYILGVGFFGGGLSMLGVVLATVLLAGLGQQALMPEGAAAVVLLVTFPEGFINGGIMAVLAVYHPHWLKTFDDRHFLDGL